MLVPGIIVLLVVGGGGFWLYQESRSSKGPAADAEAARLPKGRLQLLHAGFQEARLLAIDETRPSKDGVQGRVLRIAKDPKGLRDGAAMMSQAKRFVCADTRVWDGPEGYFDAAGRVMTSAAVYAGAHGRVFDPDELEAEAVCAPKAGAKPRIFKDYRAAQRQLQNPPADLEAAAAASPNDAHGWGWLCARAAQGYWRPEALSDCEKAVKLDPAASDIGVDQGFLLIKVGKNAAAKAAFEAVIAKDPQSAGAWFGKGLLAAMTANNNSAGHEDRVRGIAIDPKIGNWVEQRYRIGLLPEMKKG